VAGSGAAGHGLSTVSLGRLVFEIGIFPSAAASRERQITGIHPEWELTHLQPMWMAALQKRPASDAQSSCRIRSLPRQCARALWGRRVCRRSVRSQRLLRARASDPSIQARGIGLESAQRRARGSFRQYVQKAGSGLGFQFQVRGAEFRAKLGNVRASEWPPPRRPKAVGPFPGYPPRSSAPAGTTPHPPPGLARTPLLSSAPRLRVGLAAAPRTSKLLRNVATRWTGKPEPKRGSSHRPPDGAIGQPASKVGFTPSGMHPDLSRVYRKSEHPENTDSKPPAARDSGRIGQNFTADVETSTRRRQQGNSSKRSPACRH